LTGYGKTCALQLLAQKLLYADLYQSGPHNDEKENDMEGRKVILGWGSGIGMEQKFAMCRFKNYSGIMAHVSLMSYLFI